MENETKRALGLAFIVLLLFVNLFAVIGIHSEAIVYAKAAISGEAYDRVRHDIFFLGYVLSFSFLVTLATGFVKNIGYLKDD